MKRIVSVFFILDLLFGVDVSITGFVANCLQQYYPFYMAVTIGKQYDFIRILGWIWVGRKYDVYSVFLVLFWYSGPNLDWISNRLAYHRRAKYDYTLRRLLTLLLNLLYFRYQ